MQRREYLAAIGVTSSLSLAGCTDSEISTPDEEEPNQQQQEGSDSVTQFDGLNETAVYTEGEDGRLEITPIEARMRDYIISARSGRLSTSGPDNPDHTILMIGMAVENTGSSPVNAPGEAYFVLNGQQYDPSYITGAENPYDNYQEVQPGSSSTGWIDFEIPPADDEGRLILRTSSFRDAPTAEWTIDLGTIERTTFDYTGNEVGGWVEWGTDQTNYRVGVTDVEWSNGYTYSREGYEFEETPSAGNVFALVDMNVENTGDTQVSIPSTFEMSVIAGNSQVDAGRYPGDDAYESGTISTGITREGIVPFEVPQSASDYTLQINLTDDVRATWNLGSP